MIFQYPFHTTFYYDASKGNKNLIQGSISTTTKWNSLNIELWTRAGCWASASAWKRPQQPRTISASCTVCPEWRHFLSRPVTYILHKSAQKWHNHKCSIICLALLWLVGWKFNVPLNTLWSYRRRSSRSITWQILAKLNQTTTKYS